jgi:hypothetical protein
MDATPALSTPPDAEPERVFAPVPALSMGDGGPALDLVAGWASDDGDIFVVNSQGDILHGRAGGPWRVEKPFTHVHLFGIWGSSSHDVYAAGVYPDGDVEGAMLHSHGDGNWWEQSIRTGADVNAVWGSGATDVYAVGDGGVFHSRGDGTWQKDPIEVGGLRGVWGADGQVYAVGSSGTILHQAGGAFAVESSGTAADLYGLWGDGSADVYAVGTGGTILHSWGDGVWITEDPPDPAADLRSVWGADGRTVWVAGGGVLASRGDGRWAGVGATHGVVGVFGVVGQPWVVGGGTIWR